MQPLKDFAREMIILALKDLRIKEEREDTLNWFNERATNPCGYGWCLGLSELNPNLIRQKINEQIAKADKVTRRYGNMAERRAEKRKEIEEIKNNYINLKKDYSRNEIVFQLKQKYGLSKSCIYHNTKDVA